MDVRATSLEHRLAAITPESVDYSSIESQHTKDLLASFQRNPGLWQGLIAPPAPKKAAAPGPNLARMLNGVGASRWHEIVINGELRVKITTAKDKRGFYAGVGDKVNRIPIVKIEDDRVVFGMEHRGKPLRHAIKRK